jgi:hypothetical protein
MHANSLAAYETLELSARETQVLKALSLLGGAATDRQIARAMGSQDPNVSRPRITALIGKGLLHEVGSIRDTCTGKMVRVVECVR